MRIPLTFLSADQPITKRFELYKGHIIADARPVKYLTSHSVSVRSLSEFCKVMIQAADTGKCLLKGLLTQPLHCESRAGKHNTKAETHWICFDIDGTESIQTAEDFIHNVLPPAFHKVSYIEQASASQGIVKSQKYSSHLIFVLSSKIAPATLKNWFRSLNLENPLLRDELSLTSTGAGLKYKLDLTLADNSRLIYIAPPNIGHGIVDRYEGTRIRLIRKQNSVCSVTLKAPKDLNSTEIKLLKTLQKKAGLRARAPKYAVHKGETVLKLAPSQNTKVTEWRENAAGMIQLNLYNKSKNTAGDSWGYWFPKSTPDIVYNFKNEAPVLLKELDPEFYADYSNGLLGRTAEMDDTIATFTGREHFAGLDLRGGGSYVVGTWNHDTHIIESVIGINSRTMVKDWLSTRGVPVPATYPDYKLSCDPSIPMCFDKEQGVINHNHLSPYLTFPESYKKKTPPKVINYILQHVTGEDAEATRWVLNWLAFIAQFKRVSGKALLLSGTQGTGKGLLYNRILHPLFNLHAPRITGLTPLEKEFNGWMEGALIVFVDEVDITAQKHGASTVIQNLKQYVTDPTVSIRRMRKDPYTVSNCANFILASNRFDSLIIEDADRRFMVPPRQESNITDRIKKDLGLSAGLELEEAIAKELKRFAYFLMSYKVDSAFAQTIHITEERTRLMEQQKDSGQLIARTIREGNLTALFSMLMEEYPSGMAPSMRLDADFIDGSPPAVFGQVCLKHAESNTPMNVARNDLERLFRALMRREWPSRSAFSRYLSARHNLLVKPVNSGGKTIVGIHNIRWFIKPDVAKAFREWAKLGGDSGNVVPIKGRRRV